MRDLDLRGLGGFPEDGALVQFSDHLDFLLDLGLILIGPPDLRLELGLEDLRVLRDVYGDVVSELELDRGSSWLLVEGRGVEARHGWNEVFIRTELSLKSLNVLLFMRTLLI